MKVFAVISALAVAAFAQDAASGIPASIEAVLITALPTSIIDLAITNAAAASSVIASELEGSTTPSWFAALPTDVKSYFASLSSEIATASATASATVITNGSITSPSNITLAPGPVVTATSSLVNLTTASATVVYNSSSYYATLVPYTTYSNGSIGYNGTAIANGTVYTNYTTTSSTRNSSTSATTTAVGGAGGASTSGSGSGSTGASSTGTGAGSTSGSATGAASTAASTTASKAGAALPTAVFGAGVVGAMGVLGLLVL